MKIGQDQKYFHTPNRLVWARAYRIFLRLILEGGMIFFHADLHDQLSKNSVGPRPRPTRDGIFGILAAPRKNSRQIDTVRVGLSGTGPPAETLNL